MEHGEIGQPIPGNPQHHEGLPLTAHLTTVDQVARRFHEVYETLAEAFGYTTRPESAVPWDDVPEKNKSLMRAVVDVLVTEGTIDIEGRPYG